MGTEKLFEVVEGSETAHCCFSSTVVQRGPDGEENVCECIRESWAKRVARALNRDHHVQEELRDIAEQIDHISDEAVSLDDAQARAEYIYEQIEELLEDE